MRSARASTNSPLFMLFLDQFVYVGKPSSRRDSGNARRAPLGPGHFSLGPGLALRAPPCEPSAEAAFATEIQARTVCPRLSDDTSPFFVTARVCSRFATSL